jgi:lipopolysaccharide transport system permease protein
MRYPRLLLRDMVRDIRSAHGLAWALATRDISSMYRQSLLGYVWAFLPPLGTAAVFLFLRSGGTFRTVDAAIPYPIYVIIGTILWQIFADSLNAPLKAVANSRAMLVKIQFPREALVMSALFVTCFNFVVRSAVLVPALLWFAWQGQFTFHPSLLWAFPLGVLGLILLGYAIGVLLTPAGMFYNDITLGLQTLLIFWMLLSPVVIVRPQSGSAALLMRMNPVTYPLEFARNGLVGQPVHWTWFLLISAVSTLGLAVGLILYRIMLPHTVARMGM